MHSMLLLALCLILLPFTSHVTPLPLPESDGPKGRISEYLASVSSQRPHTLGTTRPPDYPLNSFGQALNKGISQIFAHILMASEKTHKLTPAIKTCGLWLVSNISVKHLTSTL